MKPPKTKETALELANEQYIFCRDIVDEGIRRRDDSCGNAIEFQLLVFLVGLMTKGSDPFVISPSNAVPNRVKAVSDSVNVVGKGMNVKGSVPSFLHPFSLLLRFQSTKVEETRN